MYGRDRCQTDIAIRLIEGIEPRDIRSLIQDEDETPDLGRVIGSMHET